MPRNNRKGITLLFVVSMIVLFLLMGTTFVIVSNDFLRSSTKRARKEVNNIDSVAYLDRAFYELIRGPQLADATSPLRGHSLLGDMYGYGFTAAIDSASPNTSGHFITMTLDLSNARTVLGQSAYTPDPVSAMAGLVLTITSGPAQGMSARIVDHQVSGESSFTHTLVVMPQTANNGFTVANSAALAGARVVINGRPFSGTGAGNYDPKIPLSQPALSNHALRPNQRGTSLRTLVGGNGAGYFSTGNTTDGYSANHAGPNESYDAYDFQNMFLAGINADGSVAHPSFHRQTLVDRAPAPTAGQTDFRDFRAFTDGGPAGDGVMVDNDNNGQVDGVWVDIGMPSQTARDGTHFKPLVSYTVVDLDGRANVNAHGNLFQETPKMSPLKLLDLPIGAASLKRGQGYGPPEFMLSAVIPNANSIIEERYGEDGKPGEIEVRDNWSSYKLHGFPNQTDDAAIPGTVDRHFGTSMDIHGRFAIGYPDNVRDYYTFEIPNPPPAVPPHSVPIGMPVSDLSESRVHNSDLSKATESVDSAYESSLTDPILPGPNNGTFDSPFTANDYEGVMRPNDPDSMFLTSRLFIPPNTRNSFGFSSFEVPTTYENLPAKLYAILNTTGDPRVGLPTGSQRQRDIRQHVQGLLPPEVFRGLPMNVNRSFGDGIDNNGNGVVDEMNEINSLEHPTAGPLTFDEDNDADVASDFDAYLARGNFARNLYIVTLLSTEWVDRNGDGRINSSDWYDFNDDGTTDEEDRIDYRKLVAQWAVNVVDFRDRDSIMTPFEVDLNPWNGWDVDGDITGIESGLGDDRKVFWGSERPELLITETFATHDRRTQNLDIDPTESFLESDPPDNDFDSHLVPAVSAFFELYVPWVANDLNQVRPSELYDEASKGVDLQKTSPDGSTPVFRLLVTGHNEADLDPDDPTNNPEVVGSPGTYEQVTSARRIYFVEPSFVVDSGPDVYYPDPNIVTRFVPPGTYAVVGSAGVKSGNEYTTYFGRRTTLDNVSPEELAETRRISLFPGDRKLAIGRWPEDTAETELEYPIIDPDPNVDERRSVVCLPIGYHNGGWERNLGISDPIDGYVELTDILADGTRADIEMTPAEDGHIFTEDVTAAGNKHAFDEPVDRMLDAAHYDEYLKDDGLKPGYRTVHLQRLANPLLSFNARSNPYLTIDSTSIDLFVFNGVNNNTAFPDPSNEPDGDGDGIADTLDPRFGTFERRSATAANGDPIHNGQDVASGRFRMLFKNDRAGHVETPADPDTLMNERDSHFLSQNFEESLGGLNHAYANANRFELQGFSWLTWNNRPFASELELANVPFTSSYWMTRLFNVNSDTTRNVYEPPVEEQAETEARNYTAHFPHLLNFYADELSDGSPAPSLHRVFDYLEVPSRFLGTESYVDPSEFKDSKHGLSFGLAPPFDTISNYRYPGKVNINTVLDARVWRGVNWFYSGAQELNDPISYTDWEDSRAGVVGAPTDFANPFRSPRAANMVPPGFSMVVNPADCGLFREESGGNPLFDYSPATKAPHNDDDRAAYFKYDKRQRLGNLVTTRSSVFAIWISIGYFEMNSNGTFKTGAMGMGGREVGEDDGTVKRNRGFFIFDRSIPVAFEPGRNHNVDRAVLIRSIIE